MESTYWSRLLERRLSRRSALRTGALGASGAGAAALLAACGGSNKNNKGASTSNGGASGTAAAKASGTAAESKPTKLGGTYNVGFTGPFNGVDPHNSVYGGSGIVPLVYSYLVRGNIFASQKGILPDLAQSYEIMPDNVTYVFKLRPDAMIAQNSLNVPVRPMDSEDVLKSFDRIKDPKVGPAVSLSSTTMLTSTMLPISKPYAW